MSSASEKLDVGLYHNLLDEFKKMDKNFKEIQDTLNQKHIEVLETRKTNLFEKERIKMLENKYRERLRDIMVSKKELQATQQQLADTDREYKKLKDLGIESMNKQEGLSQKYQELLRTRNSDESIFQCKIDELNNVINDKHFEIEQINNDINAKNVQLDKQENRINQFMCEVDKQKDAREHDKIMFEEDIKRINHENDEFRKTIYSMRMREVNTARIVSNAENKIREQHEIREDLIKKLRNQESDQSDVTKKLKNKSDRYFNLKDKYNNETKKITKNLLNRSMMADRSRNVTVDISKDLNRTFTAFNDKSNANLYKNKAQTPDVPKKSMNRTGGLNAQDQVNNQRTEISESSQRDSANSVDIRIKDFKLTDKENNNINSDDIKLQTKDSWDNEMRRSNFMLTSSAQGSFQDKYLSMKVKEKKKKMLDEDTEDNLVDEFDPNKLTKVNFK